MGSRLDSEYERSIRDTHRDIERALNAGVPERSLPASIRSNDDRPAQKR